MSGWIVYSKDGSIERCKLRSLEYGGTAMGERAVTATFDYHSEVAFEVFDYIEYRGERFELEAVPTVKKLSSFEYQYELRFVSLKYELERCEMRDLVPNDNGVVYPTPLTFSFTGDVRYLTDRIQACLDAMYGTDVWKITIAEGTSSEEKNITIAQQNCWNALALVNSTYGLNFYIKGRTITIGGEQPLVSHTFEYGKGNGLYEIERASDTETGIVTKLRAYGSTRNLDYSYPKKPEWSDSVLPVSFALSPLRLMLPSFKTDGKTDYVLADEAAIAKYGIREASMVYDDIYPSIAGATYNGQAIDEIKAVDAVDESQKTFVAYLHDLGFDLEEHLTTSDAQISMKSGALQGYTFTISAIEKQTGGYKITLGKNSLENSEESGAYVPGVNWNMKAGDKFVLLNILMPQKYIRDAENRLLARAEEYLAQYSKTNFSYNIGMHDKFLIQNPSVYDSLIEGSKLKVYDKEIGIDEEVTIQSITITENLEDNILPQVKVTLNNEPSASTLDRIQGKLNEVAAETAANGFSTQSELMAQYRKKLDKPFFEKLFVAVDKDGNDIAANDVSTPIAYIKAKYHFASVGGFTMYVMDKDVDVPSLASGLPFDGRTIWYNPDTQQIEVIGGTGGGSGEGVSNFWDLSGIPSWITNSKPKYTYSEIEGTPDLSGYATESWVLGKSYITSATLGMKLAKYVTLDTDQPLKGKKDFKNGLSIDGLEIRKSQDDVVYIDANLVVRGGVTMYGDENADIPTIYDGLPIDNVTIYWESTSNGKVLKAKVGTEGAITEITSAMVISALGFTPYDASNPNGYITSSALNGYATQTWVKNQGYLTSHQDLSGYQTKITSSNKLAYSLISGTPTSLKNPNALSFGSKSYDGSAKITLTASDLGALTSHQTIYTLTFASGTFASGTFTANSAKKTINIPTTTSHISEGSNLYFTNTRAINALAETLKAYVTLGGIQTIAGEKNFTGGLKVNGSPIVYDATKKYWKLEGDLLVTGGVTMYGSDSSFTPSTIMNALLYDDTTLGINSNGQLYVKGGAGGGINTTDLQNYLTQNSYLNVTSGDNRYLKLSGGAINGTSNSPFTINTSSQAIELQLKSNSNIKAYIGWNTTDGVFLQEGENTAYIGVQTNKNPYYFNGTRYTLWHAGNDGSGSGLDADLLDGQEETTFAKWKSGISSSDEYRHIGYAYGSEGWRTSGAAMSFGANEKYFMQIQGGGSTAKEVFLYARYIYEGIYSDWKTIAFTDSNVASATQVMMNYSYNQDVNYPLVFTSRDNIGVAQNATLYIDFSGRPTYNPKTDTLTVGNLSGNATYATNSSKLYSTDIIYSYGSTNPYYGYLTFNQTYGEWDFKVSPNTPEYIHVYSSDKLRTTRTIWGQSFDGTGNVSGNILIGVGSDYVIGTGYSSSDKRTFNNITIGNSTSGIVYNGGTWTGSTSFNAHTFTTGASSNALVINNGGNVGIGTASPNQKLHVEGGVRVNGQIIGANSIVSNTTNGFFVGNRNDGLGVTDGGLLLYTYGKTPISFYASGERMRIDASTGNVGIGTTNPSEKLHVDGNVIFEGSNTYLSLNRKSTDGGILFKHNGTNKWQMVNYDSGLNFYDYYRGKTALIIGTDGVLKFEGNILSTGGITMYSDQRKKTILNHVELSLKDIADAPLIEHYYNSDEKKTTHVGSIAQYWASMNDWFCKLDSEGYYTMEIQNAALASAISIARELDRYETKTDKAIKKLKKRICELEEEVERLRAS